MSSRPSPSRVAWYRLMKVCATQPGREKGEREAEEDLQPSSFLLNHDYLVVHIQLLLRPGQRPGTLRYVEKCMRCPSGTGMCSGHHHCSVNYTSSSGRCLQA